MRITSLAAVVSQKTTHCALLHLSVRRHDSAYCTRRPCTRISCVGEGYCTRAEKKISLPRYIQRYVRIIYMCARFMLDPRSRACTTRVITAVIVTMYIHQVYCIRMVVIIVRQVFYSFCIRFFIIIFFFFLSRPLPPSANPLDARCPLYRYIPYTFSSLCGPLPRVQKKKKKKSLVQAYYRVTRLRNALALVR